MEYTRLNEYATRYAILVATSKGNLHKFAEQDKQWQAREKKGEKQTEPSWAQKFFDWKMESLNDIVYLTEMQQRQVWQTHCTYDS